MLCAKLTHNAFLGPCGEDFSVHSVKYDGDTKCWDLYCKNLFKVQTPAAAICFIDTCSNMKVYSNKGEEGCRCRRALMCARHRRPSVRGREPPQPPHRPRAPSQAPLPRAPPRKRRRCLERGPPPPRPRARAASSAQASGAGRRRLARWRVRRAAAAA